MCPSDPASFAPMNEPFSVLNEFGGRNDNHRNPVTTSDRRSGWRIGSGPFRVFPGRLPGIDPGWLYRSLPGHWLARQLGLPEVFTITVEGEPFPVLWGIIGSALLSLILGAFSRRSIA